MFPSLSAVVLNPRMKRLSWSKRNGPNGGETEPVGIEGLVLGMCCMSGVSCLRLSCCMNALNCCVRYLCLTGWVYVFYVGYVDKIMKSFSML
jgi:hypothetical protein